jgi:hypothetical protein
MVAMATAANQPGGQAARQSWRPRRPAHRPAAAAVITCRFSVHTQTVFSSSVGAAAEADLAIELRDLYRPGS